MYDDCISESQLLNAEDCIKEHTMHSDVLRTYIEMKLPITDMLWAIDKATIEVHGIYPTHAENVFKHLGYIEIKPISYKPNKSSKKYNYLRPVFFSAKYNNSNVLLVAVTPGYNYVRQYGEMIRFFAHFNDIVPDDVVKIKHYPKVYSSISDWTNLDSLFIQKEEIVIIGYVEELESRLLNKEAVEFQNEYENEYYGSRRYKIGKNNVNFLGVKYSFWGDISATLARRIYDLGASHIIYTAKTGSLTSTADLYGRMYSSSNYLLMNCEKVIEKITELPNIFDSSAEKSDFHVSIPTVMEEDYKQRETAIKRGAISLDNEVSQIASVTNFLKDSGVQCDFSYIHFATDYLYGPEEELNPNSPNLTKGRTAFLKDKKTQVLGKMGDSIYNYLTII